MGIVNVFEWRIVLAAVAWTTVVGLAMTRAIASIEGLTVWSILVGHVAMVVTGWLLVDRVVNNAVERAINEHHHMNDAMVERVAVRIASALDEGTVTSLR